MKAFFDDMYQGTGYSKEDEKLRQKLNKMNLFVINNILRDLSRKAMIDGDDEMIKADFMISEIKSFYTKLASSRIEYSNGMLHASYDE